MYVVESGHAKPTLQLCFASVLQVSCQSTVSYPSTDRACNIVPSVNSFKKDSPLCTRTFGRSAGKLIAIGGRYSMTYPYSLFFWKWLSTVSRRVFLVLVIFSNFASDDRVMNEVAHDKVGAVHLFHICEISPWARRFNAVTIVD